MGRGKTQEDSAAFGARVLEPVPRIPEPALFIPHISPADKATYKS